MRKYNGYKRNLTRVLAVIVMLTAFVIHAAAVEEPREITKKGSELVNLPLNTVITNADPVFGSANWNGQTANGVKNIILFEIDFNNEANKYFQNLTFTATCTVDIRCYGNPSSPTTITQTYPGIALQVNFNPAAGAIYKGIAEYKFNGAYKVDVVFKGITATGLSPVTSYPIFSLTNKLIVDRQYNFNDNSTDLLKYTTDGQKLTVNWTPTAYPGAESFDLEWTYVDETSDAGVIINQARTLGQTTISQATLESFFRNNSSRVNLPPGPAEYKFNLNYNKGFILFRMRGVQFRNSDGLRLEGNWNYTADAITGSLYTFFDQGIVDVDWHEKELNWQYNAVYAEDGKRKEVISYFDGALRSRQTVTINNQDNVSVVAEPVYDALGRPSMSILPAPVSDNLLKYFRSFNVNNSLRPVSYKDIPSANCGIISSALSSSSGVEKYYSENNPFINDPAKPWNKAIPKSEGFPYTVTQYTPDNTGRIRAQSGVGAAFQLGTGHETKFYYGKPSQYELDRLFGAEAGDHTHYLKNMVKDANGQVSVSYQNSEGKTIATALAGLPPTQTEALASAAEPTTLVKDILITPSSFQVNVANSSLEATNTFLVSSTGNYKFTYKFVPEKYTEAYSGGTLCYTCSYDLLITLRDECGAELNRTELKNITPFNTSCANPAELSNFFNATIQQIGEYTAYFELKVNRETLDAYTEHYLANNTDIRKLNYFLLEQLVEENLSECYSDCEACKTLPATAAEFVAKVQAYYTKEGITFGAAESAFATNLYNTIKQNCVTIGQQCVQSPCDEILDVIKADVTPGGQYAEYDENYNLKDPQINVLAHYQNPVTPYSPATVEDGNGNVVPVAQLSLKDFILKFEDSWAVSLAPYHPEYCYYTWCTMNPGSRQFDQTLEEMNDPTDAVTTAYFDRTNPLKLLQADPFFQLGGYGYSYTTQMQADLNTYSVNVMNLAGQTPKNIFQTIDYLLYCGNQVPAISWDFCNKAVADPCRSDYKEWVLYKEWYLELKQKYYTLAMQQQMPACKNCFIPSSGNTDPGGWTNCIAPPVNEFSIADVPNSAADGLKRILIKYKDGNAVISWPVTVAVQMTNTSTGIMLTQDIVFVPGFGTQEMQVQGGFNLFAITGVTCTQLTGRINNGMITTGKPAAENTTAVNGLVLCPDLKDFTWTFAPGSQGDRIDICYTGPAIPAGQVVSLTGRIMFNWSHFFDFTVDFCSELSPCQIAIPFVDSYWVPMPGYIQVELYTVTCGTGTCSQTCFTEGTDYTIDYLTGEVCSLSDSWTDISVKFITYCGTLTYSMANPGQGNCMIFPDWRSSCGPIIASQPSFTGPCPGGTWPCPVGDFNYNITQGQNVVNSSWDIRVCYTGPAIPAGKRVTMNVTATNPACSPSIPTVNFVAQFCASQNCFTYSIPSSAFACDVPWSISYKITCTDQPCETPCPTGDCCDDPRYSLYKGKVKRFQDYLAPDFTAIQNSTLNNPSNNTAYPLATCKNECEAMADAWMAQLKNCSSNLQQLERIRRQLITICKNSCAAQQGSTTIHPFADQNPSPSFESVIIAEFGSLTPNCAYDLISDPYPWGKVPAMEKTFAAEASTQVCNRLQQLRTEAQSKGYANTLAGVHQYLKDYYSPYYDLEDDELQQLFDACNGCNGIMKLPVELPPFMNGDAKDCLPCTVYEQKKAQFLAKYPGITPAHDNYEVLFRNYMNHQTGFSHAYASYYDFELKCAANLNNFRQFGKVCETPLSMEADVNTLNQCMDEKFYNALSNATVIYTRYIEEIKRVYRNNYTAKCLSAKPRLEAEARLYEYHYTLYYYDQSDNLVKTVPPQGVAFLTDAQINTLWTDRNQFIVPAHTLASTYQYNSFNQVVKQYSPDGGTSEFWYDRLGRLTVSQNEEQKTPVNGGNTNRYSYTKYEPVLGRITEVGEKSGAAAITTIDTRNDAHLQSWLASGTDAQITSTIYDQADLTQVTNTAITGEQQFYTSRKRVVTAIFRKTRYAGAAQYDAATHYSYDILGNAKTVWQENSRLKEADASTQGIKRMDYEFDLVAGKVNRVWYQKNKGDQFIYEYKYDMENRVTAARTSRDGLVWQEDAAYKYYLHGPLARTELGRLKVQGTDYAYTLQGWMKYINAPVINETVDISRDGDPTLANNIYKSVGRDALGYGISYFNGEYKPVFAASPLPWNEVIPGTQGTGKELFNGNIRATTVQIAQLGGAKTYSYSYDQLNRLVKMRKHETSYIPRGAADPYLDIAAAGTEYQENVSYDANGNILTYLRNGTASQPAMDDLTYQYPKDAGGRILNNRLRYIFDPVPVSNYAEDVDNQTTLSLLQVQAERLPEQASDNYAYDKTGNLVKDSKEKIAKIEWTVYGKISKITKNDVNGTTIEYEYDAAGNRIYKKVSNNSLAGTVKQTFYIRDAGGNTIAIYTRTDAAAVQWAEQHLYGSSRLGIFSPNIPVPASAPVPADGASLLDGVDLGKVAYELSNHLGNVLVTISDKKVQFQNGTSGTVLYHSAEILTATDYYPGGMEMPGRKYSSDKYRYGFNGKENDNEVKGEGNQQDYGMRIYDPRLGRFLSVDPIEHQYPELTPYQFASNRPIDGVDLDGLEYVKRIHTVNAQGQVIATKDIIYYQMDDETLRAHGGTTKGLYNSAGYGPEGKGIKHEYYFENGRQASDPVWNLKGSYATHGLYSGDGCITYTSKKDYDFSWKPIDQADAIAKRHDMNYSSVGAYDVVEDSRTLSADKQMVEETAHFLNTIPRRVIFGERVAGETIVAAKSQNAFIGILADYKEWKQKYMRRQGLDPNSKEDNKKVSLDSWKVKYAFVRSKQGSLAKLAILLAAKSQTSESEDKKKKGSGASGSW
ncbi:MAG: hypothetical protein HZA79_12520 [Sphingobacteriales bacterium]|nr:hypothetical protein [Sphingobacteriales bacterium]